MASTALPSTAATASATILSTMSSTSSVPTTQTKVSNDIRLVPITTIDQDTERLMLYNRIASSWRRIQLTVNIFSKVSVSKKYSEFLIWDVQLPKITVTPGWTEKKLPAKEIFEKELLYVNPTRPYDESSWIYFIETTTKFKERVALIKNEEVTRLDSKSMQEAELRTRDITRHSYSIAAKNVWSESEINVSLPPKSLTEMKEKSVRFQSSNEIT